MIEFLEGREGLADCGPGVDWIAAGGIGDDSVTIRPPGPIIELNVTFQQHPGSTTMSTSIADERRLLAAEEYKPVERSHYPALSGLSREELRELVHWLRSQRDKFRRQVEHHGRVHRGKAEPRGIAGEPAGGRGIAAKKQVFARALKRVNSRLDSVLAADKRAAMRAGLEAALERKRKARRHHPTGGRPTGSGAPSIENPKGTDIVAGATIGRISQAGRKDQARRDNRENRNP